MAPRMVYCKYLKLTLEHNVEVEYDVSIRQLPTLFHMYLKPANTIRSMVVHPKDKTPKEHKCGTIYNITCDIDSSHTYIGETKRILSQRFKEHTNQQE